MKHKIVILLLCCLPGCHLANPNNSNCDSCIDAGIDLSIAPDATKPDSGIDAKKPDLSPVYIDNDKDGYYSNVDCNDDNPKVHPNAPEVCNGIDDDCDGDSDNNPIDVGVPCGSSVGECLPGADTCINGQIKCAGAKLPQNELCDGKDNDCDGKTDEDYPDLGRACDEGAGACKQSGHLVCNGSATILKCDAKPFKATIEGPPGDSTCNDKIDNDCDGFTDDADSDCNNCATDADCNQGNKCEIAKCLNGVCERKPFFDGTPCPDDKFCNGIETCKDGKCSVLGVKETCNDGDQCTDDSCDENKSPHCVNLSKIISNAKEGLPGSLECNDGQDNDCDGKKDTDDEDCRECENDFECVKDTNPCMNYFCNSKYICKSSPKADNAPCDDNLKCNGTEICKTGKCATAGQPIVCPNGPCATGLCDETQNGKCILVPLAECECSSASDCNDSNDCTIDKCTNNKCMHEQKTDGMVCNDGAFCTVSDKCQGGQCLGTKRDCSAYADSCNMSVCNEQFDVCEKLPKANGTPCDDNLYCNGHESCLIGACMPGTAPVCNDNDACTDDVCDPILDKCVFNPKNLSGQESWAKPGTCSDGKDNDCDGKFDYADLDCRQCGTNADCEDFNDCTSDICNTSTWKCEHTNLNGNACDDGKWCTTGDKCNNGACGGTLRDCAASGDVCNSGICNEVLDVCQKSPKSDSTSCDDGKWCTVNDHCSSGTCVSGGDRSCGQGYICDESSDQCLFKQCASNNDCNDYNQCTSDVCNTSTWTCMHNNLNGNTCDDGKWCTTNDVCNNGACTGTQMNCSDYGDQCNDGVCDEYSHTCKKQQKPNNTQCDDGLWCTIGEYCVSGYCINGQPRNCNPGTCNETYDKCDYPQSAPGCSDGSREGFLDGNTFPNIAGCSGGWSIPGLTASQSGTPAGSCSAAGNSSSNPNGNNCNAANLCAYGWRICNDNQDVASHLPSGKSCFDAASGSEKLFFATRQGSSGFGICDNAGTNDVFGCGNYGATPKAGTCSTLNYFGSEDCQALTPPGYLPSWDCGTDPIDNNDELKKVKKLDSNYGGVLCCKN